MSTIDTTALGVLCAKVMEQTASMFGQDCYVRTACVLVEVDSVDSTHILSASTDDRSWVQIAFLDEAARHLEMQRNEAEAESE